MIPELFRFTCVIVASAEDMCVLLRIGGMWRPLVEQHVRADQATAALQGMPAQQQQTAGRRQLTSRATVRQLSWTQTRLRGKPVAFDG